jgi:hypothetical protein
VVPVVIVAIVVIWLLGCYGNDRTCCCRRRHRDLRPKISAPHPHITNSTQMGIPLQRMPPRRPIDTEQNSLQSDNSDLGPVRASRIFV